MDICTMACERFAGFEKSPRYAARRCTLIIMKPPVRGNLMLLPSRSSKWSLRRYMVESLRINQLIPMNFEYGGCWQVVVGESFSLDVTHYQGMLLHFHFGGVNSQRNISFYAKLLRTSRCLRMENLLIIFKRQLHIIQVSL